MPESFDAFQYIGHVRARWRVFTLAAIGAVAIALAASLLVAKQYTAICRVLIEPPPGTDLRAAMAISPIYLESLRTYEHFASSDSLFLRALEHFKLRGRYGTKPLEALKQRVLRVEILRNTRILEISATLPEARAAHALALYLAEQTVTLNRSVIDEGNREVAGTAERQFAEARQKLDRAEQEWARLIAREPVDALQAEIESQGALKARIERDLLDTEADLAEYSAREADRSASRLRDATTRAGILRKQVAGLEAVIARSQAQLAGRISRRDRMQAERQAAQATFAAVENRLREVRGDLGYRGERLKIIDPGIVPERPSSPNVLLNVLAALLLALVAALFYVTLQFGMRQRLPEPRLAGRGAR